MIQVMVKGMTLCCTACSLLLAPTKTIALTGIVKFNARRSRSATMSLVSTCNLVTSLSIRATPFIWQARTRKSHALQPHLVLRVTPRTPNRREGYAISVFDEKAVLKSRTKLEHRTLRNDMISYEGWLGEQYSSKKPITSMLPILPSVNNAV